MVQGAHQTHADSKQKVIPPPPIILVYNIRDKQGKEKDE